MSKYHFSYKTDMGDIVVIYNEEGVSDVILPYDNMDSLDGSVYQEDNTIKKYFDDYFKGIEPGEIKINIKPTEFQKKVYDVLLSTKKGSILTYGDVASMIGCASPRAIGQALKKNPVPVIIPCHRVVGKGWEGGFGGETVGEKMTFKRFLLELEKR